MIVYMVPSDDFSAIVKLEHWKDSRAQDCNA